MSEPIPESIPTSADPRSNRPTKRRALSPRAGHASAVSALFSNPARALIPNASPRESRAAPPETVSNVQGSSAGAGSGEFHVYKASRRREYERLRAMDEEVQAEADADAFGARRADQERRDREKTERNRLKRAKALARKHKGKTVGPKAADGGKRKLVPSTNAVGVSANGPSTNGASTNGPTTSIDQASDEHGSAVPNVEERGLVIEDDD